MINYQIFRKQVQKQFNKSAVYSNHSMNWANFRGQIGRHFYAFYAFLFLHTGQDFVMFFFYKLHPQFLF